MHKPSYALILAVGLLLSLSTSASSAESSESITPQPRLKEYEWMTTERWQQMHAEDVAIAKKDDIELLFIGDSITEGWPQNLWEEYFGGYRAANFAIGGDKTENLLWRLDHGSVGKLDPEVVSLLIGVNNFGLSNHSPEEVIAGIEAVVGKLKQKFPNAKILLHGIFPHKESAQHQARDQVRQVNRAVAELADDPRVYFLDIGTQLVEANGDISPEIMPDYLHLSEQGYRIWARNVTPLFAGWLQDCPANHPATAAISRI